MSTIDPLDLDPIILDGTSLTCADLHAIAHGAPVRLSDDARARMADNAAAALDHPDPLEAKRRWLVGDYAQDLHTDELARAFVVGHMAGVGDPLPDAMVRATMAARANVLAVGLSGCRPVVADALLAFLDAGLCPVVPSQGSVGAAGDLAPLAHVASVLCGWFPPPGGALPDGYTPLAPTGKEALALINGISMTTALAAVAVVRARRVLDAAVAACAMTMETVGADAGCIDARPHAARLHPGGQRIAAQLRAQLRGSVQVRPGRKADAFSIRCAPTVLGAARDVIDQVEATIERELNGASDNPLLFTDPRFGADDGPAPAWVEAGNFHGAPVAMAMDQLKLALAQIATISERRTYRLVYGQLTPGLPSFLVPGTGLNSGYMLAQYTAASLTSELKGLCHPASVDTIPTVQHHEDHNSMGPAAARTALEVIECCADVVAIEAVVAAQGLELRQRGWRWAEDGTRMPDAPVVLAPAIADRLSRVRERIAFWEDDGVLHPVLADAGTLVRSGGLHGVPAPW